MKKNKIEVQDKINKLLLPLDPKKDSQTLQAHKKLIGSSVATLAVYLLGVPSENIVSSLVTGRINIILKDLENGVRYSNDSWTYPPLKLEIEERDSLRQILMDSIKWNIENPKCIRDRVKDQILCCFYIEKSKNFQVTYKKIRNHALTKLEKINEEYEKNEEMDEWLKKAREEWLELDKWADKKNNELSTKGDYPTKTVGIFGFISGLMILTAFLQASPFLLIAALLMGSLTYFGGQLYQKSNWVPKELSEKEYERSSEKYFSKICELDQVLILNKDNNRCLVVSSHMGDIKKITQKEAESLIQKNQYINDNIIFDKNIKSETIDKIIEFRKKIKTRKQMVENQQDENKKSNNQPEYQRVLDKLNQQKNLDEKEEGKDSYFVIQAYGNTSDRTLYGKINREKIIKHSKVGNEHLNELDHLISLAEKGHLAKSKGENGIVKNKEGYKVKDRTKDYRLFGKEIVVQVELEEKTFIKVNAIDFKDFKPGH